MFCFFWYKRSDGGVTPLIIWRAHSVSLVPTSLPSFFLLTFLTIDTNDATRQLLNWQFKLDKLYVGFCFYQYLTAPKLPYKSWRWYCCQSNQSILFPQSVQLMAAPLINYELATTCQMLPAKSSIITLKSLYWSEGYTFQRQGAEVDACAAHSWAITFLLSPKNASWKPPRKKQFEAGNLF